MLFRQLFDPVSSTYSYLLADEASREAILIDPVFEHHERDAALIRELGLDLKYTLDTHAHADHVTGAWLMKQRLGSDIVLSRRYGAENVDLAVDHDDVIKFGDQAVRVRATPGHTDGCLTFVTDKDMAFTGDALLIRGAGRTDFQAGDARQLYHSIKNEILTLPEQTLLYPAHDYQGRTVTTVGEEQRHNARIGGDASETDFVGFMNNLGLPHPRKIDIAVPANLRSGKPDEDAVAPPSWGPIETTYAGIPQISPEWVGEHLDRVHILDVRAPGEFAEGHIEGAQLIDLDDLRARIEDVPKSRPVVAVCRSGRRSAQATNILRKAGWDDAANLQGGMLWWRALGLPVVSQPH